MCKLVAYVNLDNSNTYQNVSAYTKMFRHLLYINSFGNTDGTGVMHMKQDGKTYMHKRGIPSPDFLQLKLGKMLTDIDKDSKFIVGHTRYGTVGGISDENAHPFRHGDIMLVQNGTSHYGYKRLIAGNKDIEVDSEAVCYSIANKGVAQTFKEYEGAGVFMWFNLKDKTFNLVKNDERTLFYGKVLGKNIYFITTDDYALEYTALRAGVSLEFTEAVEDNILFTYGIDSSFNKTPMVVSPEYTSYYNNWNVKTPTKDKGEVKESKWFNPDTLKLSCDLCEDDIEKGEQYYSLEDGSTLCKHCAEYAFDMYSIQRAEEKQA